MSYKIDPVKQGREDCDDAIASGANAAELVHSPPDDEALINSMNRDWVLDAAGADPNADRDEEWSRIGLPWCAEYNVAFRERAVEIAQ